MAPTADNTLSIKVTNPKTEIILALDLDSRAEVCKMLDQLKEGLNWVKIGLQSFLRDGPAIIEECVSREKKVFLDLKLHDIPNTMAKAIESLANLPIQMLTLHTCAGSEAMSRCVETASAVLPQTTLLGVTVLTSMNRSNLNDIGVLSSTEEQVCRLAHLAVKAGVGGIVCSPQELSLLRPNIPSDTCLVTPGIRPSGSSAGDQKRTMTPKEAQFKGANYLVIGRPILSAKNPSLALNSIKLELES